jgi:hypothetical protein
MGIDLFHSHWAPKWLKRVFPGRWTQAEVDRINAQAERRYAEFQKYVD